MVRFASAAHEHKVLQFSALNVTSAIRVPRYKSVKYCAR